jgi:hypothetical protein
MHTYDILVFNPLHDLRTKTKISPSGSVEVVVRVRLVIICELFLDLGIEIVGIIIIRFHDWVFARV